MLNRILDNEEDASEQLWLLARGVAKSTEKLTYLIADLLNSNNIEQGQLALNRTNFPVAEVMDCYCSPIQVEDVHQLKFEGDHSTMIYADPQKIEQVLINMVNNPIKYAPKTLMITLWVDQLAAAVKITVIDQGPGIAPEHVKMLFNRNFRIDEEKHQPSGLGLGFYVSAEIIKRHGGEIGVDSKPGQG